MTTIRDQVDAVLAGPCPAPIVVAGDPILRRPAVDLDRQLDDATVRALIAVMRETMLAAPGVGLAAPQIGIGLRLAVLEDPATAPVEVAATRDRYPLPFHALVNPRYTEVGADRATFYEGCLSVPGYQAAVDRAAVVRVRALDTDGGPVDREYRGWAARIVQHECDHLDGTLYLDRALLRSLADVPSYHSRWSGPSIEPARAALGF